MNVEQHHLHMSSEVEIRITDAAELVLWSKRDERILVAFTPRAAEAVVLEVFDKWPTAAQLLLAKAGQFRSAVAAETEEGRKRTSRTRKKEVKTD